MSPLKTGIEGIVQLWQTGGRGGVLRLLIVSVLVLIGAQLAEARPYLIAWDANADGVTVGYYLYYGTAPGTYQPVGGIDVGNDTEFQVDLTPGQTYYFIVRAYNDEGILGPPSTELAFSVPFDPTIDASPGTVSAGSTITVIVDNAPGHRYDWVGLYPVGNSITGYVAEKYLNDTNTAPDPGLTGGTVTFTAPSQPGQYNVRLNSSEGSTLATSLAITVGGNPSVTPSTTSVAAGGTVTATIADSPGASRFDWVGFYPVGNGVTGFVYEKYLNNTSTPPVDPMTSGSVSFATATSLPPGSYDIRLVSAAGTVLATSAAITVTGPPTITLGAATASPGGSVTATVANSPGDSQYDWVGFYPVGNGVTGYVYEKYLNDSSTPPASPMNGGSVTFSLAGNLPQGSYNVRLISSAGVTLTTSSTITVLPPPAISATPNPIQPGNALTVTVSNSPGGSRYDWVGFYPEGNGFGGYIYEKYLNDSNTPPASPVTDATITFALSSSLPAGNYNVRLNSGGGTTLLTSATITLTPPPSVGLSASTIPAGGSITAIVANSPGQSRYDWIGFYPVGNGFTGFLYEKYLNDSNAPPASPMTGGNVTFALPGSLPAGQYNIRLNSASGVTVATSNPITVTSGATIDVSATTVAPGGQVTVTFGNGPGARWDWIGLYPAGNGSTGFVDWKYLNGTQVAPGAGITSGSVDFTMPTSPGVYNLRFFYTYESGTPLAVSVAVTVQ